MNKRYINIFQQEPEIVGKCKVCNKYVLDNLEYGYTPKGHYLCSEECFNKFHELEKEK